LNHYRGIVALTPSLVEIFFVDFISHDTVDAISIVGWILIALGFIAYFIKRYLLPILDIKLEKYLDKQKSAKNESIRNDLRNRKDFNTIISLLSCIHTSTFDEFISRGHTGYVISSIFPCNECFNERFTASDFNLYDNELYQKLNDFHQSWNGCFDFIEYFSVLRDGKTFKFDGSQRHMQPDFDKDYAKFLSLIRTTEIQFKEILSYINKKYPEFDISITNKKAVE
jgi:hypothetical protein